MSQPKNDDEPLPPNPGCWMLVIPIVMTVLIVVGYFGMLVLGLIGRAPKGPVETVTFTGCPEARPILEARVAEMGLGDAAWSDVPGGYELTARFPEDAHVDEQIPSTLAETGQFEIRAVPSGDVVLSGHVAEATLELEQEPMTLVQLDDEGADFLRKYMEKDPNGRIAYLIDGKPVYERSNLPPEARGALEIEPPSEGTLQERTEWSVSHALVLDNGPLPCPVSVAKVETESPAK